MTFEKDTIIGELLDADPSCESVFVAFDMPCMSCPSSWGETLEEACDIHGVRLEEVIDALQEYFNN